MKDKVIFLKKQFLENPAHQWTVTEMSESVKITSAQLHKIFKDETGIAPMNYLHDLRLEKMKELLETGFLRVHQICRQVGINDESHCVRDFKKKYGLTPGEYRQQYHEKLEAEDANDQE